MLKSKKRNVQEEVKNGIKDLEAKLTEIEKTMKINSKEIQEELKKEEVVKTEEELAPLEVVSEEKDFGLVENYDYNYENDKPEEVVEEPKEEVKEEVIALVEEPSVVMEEPKEEKPVIEEPKIEKAKEEVVPEVKVDKTPVVRERRIEDIKVKSNNAVIVVCLLAALLLYCLPMVFISLAALDMNKIKLDYKTLDNMVVIGKDNVKITELNSYYNEDLDSFVIYGFAETNKNYDLEISYDLYDEKGYIIGTSTATMDMKKGNKYKLKAVYTGLDAKEVVEYKISKVYSK